MRARADFLEDMGFLLAKAFGSKEDHPAVVQRRKLKQKRPQRALAKRGAITKTPDGGYEVTIPLAAVRKFETPAQRKAVMDILRAQGRDWVRPGMG